MSIFIKELCTSGIANIRFRAIRGGDCNQPDVKKQIDFLTVVFIFVYSIHKFHLQIRCLCYHFFIG